MSHSFIWLIVCDWEITFFWLLEMHHSLAVFQAFFCSTFTFPRRLTHSCIIYNASLFFVDEGSEPLIPGRCTNELSLCFVFYSVPFSASLASGKISYHVFLKWCLKKKKKKIHQSASGAQGQEGEQTCRSKPKGEKLNVPSERLNPLTDGTSMRLNMQFTHDHTQISNAL